MHLGYTLARFLLFALAAAPAVLVARDARAQEPGSCELGSAEAELDVGAVYAKVFNTGSLFFGNSSQAAYLVPRHEGRSAIFAASVWIGGLVDGELRLAGASYADFEFWPGPLNAATGRPPDPSDCSAHDRIWRVSRHDVAEFYRTGSATQDLAEWPFVLGAPVLDGDGDTTNYDLTAGDQPAIAGDQMLWWVMNDVGNAHFASETPAVGLEVRVSAFAFGSGPAALREATFYRYQIIYRGEVPVEDAYFMIWADPDLGDAADDASGVDTLRHLSYWYNADNQDGSGTGGTYGEAPPALGLQLLRGLVAPVNQYDDDRDGEVDEAGELLGMTSAMGGYRSPVPGVPWNGLGWYNRMRGRWNNGVPITERGGGYQEGGPVTTFMFAGDPVAPRFWSQRCLYPTGACQTATPSDQHVTLATGPVVLERGVWHDLLVAIPYARAENHIASVADLRVAATQLENARDAGLLDARRVPGFEGPAPPIRIEIRRPAPNPFTEWASMSITLPAAAGVRVALVDVLGREVAVLADGPHEAGVHPIAITGAGLAPGVYVARVWVAGQPAGALPVTRR